MKCKKRILCCIICLLLFFSITAQASEGEVVPRDNGQSDVMAGVVVNYMGKLEFLILEEGSKRPIPGASVELYIPSIDRYVLVGMTDENGILLLDVAYNTSQSEVEGEQFQTSDGELKFDGRLLYLNSNEISYQVYKYDWRPYPKQGSVVLETKVVPQIVTEYLYRKSSGGGSGGGGGSQITPSTPTVGAGDELAPPLPEDEKNGIPKTGVEGTMQYWILGMLFFAGAGLLLINIWKKERKE